MSRRKYVAARRRIGSLDCVVVHPSPAATPKALVVLCHGFGASGDDLVGLSSDILHARNSDEPIALVYPAALLSLADQGFADGRAWWPLSIQRLMNAMDSGQFELIREESPEGIDEARIALTGTIQFLLDEMNLSLKSLILGGFSQGAMLAMETACCGLSGPVGGLILFSGCLIRERQWKTEVAKLRDTKVVQSHGDQDMILPLRTGVWLKELLEENGCQVDFLQFHGPHTISGEAIEHTAALIDTLAEASD